MTAYRPPHPYQGPTNCRWYGEDPVWRLPMEAVTRRRFGTQLRTVPTQNTLEYSLPALPVSGRDPVAVTITFDRQPGYRHFQLPPQDFPTVHADPGALSKHRNPDGSLCLFYPFDPPDQRWTSEMGLNVLLDLVAEHLFAELFWRQTGGHRHGRWVLNEAPHGIAT